MRISTLVAILCCAMLLGIQFGWRIGLAYAVAIIAIADKGGE